METEKTTIQLMSEDADTDAKAEVGFENTLPLAEAVKYMEAIAAGLRNGSVHMRQGDRDLTLTPVPKVTMEVKAVRKKKKEGLALEIFWRTIESDKLEIS